MKTEQYFLSKHDIESMMCGESVELITKDHREVRLTPEWTEDFSDEQIDFAIKSAESTNLEDI